MIPIGDDNTTRKTLPVITYLLIILNILFFFLEISGGEEFIKRWAFIPSRFLSQPLSDSITILTSMFMHAGFMHLVGNMIYLWIFGDNIEDRVGKVPYLLFYLICGCIATFSQMMFDPHSSIPQVGASGAIAGILGAYILLFPSEKVKVLLGQSLVQLPALIVIGFWFIIQFISSVGSAANTGESGGVAYMAHIGGFLGGLILAFIYKSLGSIPNSKP